MYPAQIVIPMKEELTENGFEELLTPEDVDAMVSDKGTTLVVINSVVAVRLVVPAPVF